MKKSKMQLQLEKAREIAVKRSRGEYKEVAPKIFKKENAKALNMAFAYEKALGKYVHKPSLQFFRKFSERGVDPRVIHWFEKAVKVADLASVDYEEYIDSQFYWFHKWFNRHPRLVELSSGDKTTPSSRLAKYLVLKKKGLIDDIVYSPVILTKKIDPKVLDKINKERLQELCEAWNITEKEAFSKFALSGFFDNSWLQKQSGFKELKKKSKS